LLIINPHGLLNKLFKSYDFPGNQNRLRAWQKCIFEKKLPLEAIWSRDNSIVLSKLEFSRLGSRAQMQRDGVERHRRLLVQTDPLKVTKLDENRQAISSRDFLTDEKGEVPKQEL
jgi:hypothetical protein